MALVPNTENFTYVWKVENFSSWVQKRGERVKSPWFTAETLDGTKWRLDLYPRGIDNGNEICISCYLCRSEKDSGDDNVIIGYEFEILGVDGTPLLSKRVESFSFKRKESLGWPDFKSLNEIFRDKSVFLPKDVLTIRCYMWGSFSKNLRATRCSALTEIGVGGCSFKWSIKLSTLDAAVHYFVPGPWRIELTFFVTEDENITFKIRKFGEVTNRYILLCRVSLLDAEGVSRDARESEHLIWPKQKMKIWEYTPFGKKSDFISENGSLQNDDPINFHCEFSISHETESVKSEEPKPQPRQKTSISVQMNEDIDILKKDLNRMLVENKFSDLELKTENRTFYAHKAILSVRSSKFAEQLHKNKFETCLDVHDLTVSSMEDLLKFMYTSDLEDIDYNKATNLFIAAKKYGVTSLKDKCAAYLKSTLSSKTVCEILILTDEYHEENLKSAAMDFLKENINEILPSDEWKHLIETNIKLATDTLCKLSIKIGGK